MEDIRQGTLHVCGFEIEYFELRGVSEIGGEGPWCEVEVAAQGEVLQFG